MMKRPTEGNQIQSVSKMYIHFYKDTELLGFWTLSIVWIFIKNMYSQWNQNLMYLELGWHALNRQP
jgi:hypothetical protein